MAVRPSPDRSDLESKTREDLQTIAKVKGVDVSARASKASLIEAIMGDPAPATRPLTPRSPLHAPCARVAPSPRRPMTSMTCSVSSSPTPPPIARAATPVASDGDAATTEAPSAPSSTAPNVTTGTSSERPAPPGPPTARLRQRHRRSQPPQPPQPQRPRALRRRLHAQCRPALRRRTHRDRRSARPARRRLRLLAHQELPPVAQRRLRLDQPGAPLPPAQGRHDRRRVPSGGLEREVPGAAARRQRRRHRPRSGATASALRGPHAALPRREAEPRDSTRARPTSRRASSTCSRRSARASAD